jgi:hypothetical protein
MTLLRLIRVINILEEFTASMFRVSAVRLESSIFLFNGGILNFFQVRNDFLNIILIKCILLILRQGKRDQEKFCGCNIQQKYFSN